MEKIVKRNIPASVNAPEKTKRYATCLLRLCVLLFSVCFSSPLYSVGLNFSERQEQKKSFGEDRLVHEHDNSASNSAVESNIVISSKEYEFSRDKPQQESADSKLLAQEEKKERGDNLQPVDGQTISESEAIETESDQAYGEQTLPESKTIDNESEQVDDKQVISQSNTDSAVNAQRSASRSSELANSSGEDNPKRPLDSLSASSAGKSVSPKANVREKREEKAKPVRLFNTVDLFRKQIKGVVPKWERVVNYEKKKKELFGEGAKERMPAKVYKQWQALKEKVKNLSDIEKAKVINRFFNQWPYKTDMDLWGVEDYWESPEEFLKRSGDCTDYAITKYYALRALGVPAEKMRIVALIDRIKGIGHAVLAFYQDDTAYVLDNTTALFLEHTKYSHYEPKYSVNEIYRWNHARILKKPRVSGKNN